MTQKLKSEVPFLGAPRKITGYLEITLNYPRTALFLKKNSTQQKALYSKIWHYIKNACGIPDESPFVFEYCSTGQVHLHGYISLHGKYFIMGAISDIVKSILNSLPKKYCMFKEGSMYVDYERYRCPSCCVQHRDNIDKWLTYMNKCDYNKI